MEPNPHYRYVRSLGCGASLFAVTEPGIDEFLAAPDASHPGIVVLALDGAEGEPAEVRFLGGPRVGELVRILHEGAGADLAEARPLAVVSVEAGAGERWVGEGIAGALRGRHEAASSRTARPSDPDFGRFAPILEGMAEALTHVLGLDPFEPRPSLN